MPTTPEEGHRRARLLTARWTFRLQTETHVQRRPPGRHQNAHVEELRLQHASDCPIFAATIKKDCWYFCSQLPSQERGKCPKNCRLRQFEDQEDLKTHLAAALEISNMLEIWPAIEVVEAANVSAIPNCSFRLTGSPGKPKRSPATHSDHSIL